MSRLSGVLCRPGRVCCPDAKQGELRLLRRAEMAGGEGEVIPRQPVALAGGAESGAESGAEHPGVGTLTAGYATAEVGVIGSAIPALPQQGEDALGALR